MLAAYAAPAIMWLSVSWNHTWAWCLNTIGLFKETRIYFPGLKPSFQNSSTFPNYCNLNGGEGDVSGNSLSGHGSKPSSQMPRLFSFFSERNNFSFTALAIRMLTKCKLCIMFLFWIICGILWSPSGWAKQFHQKQEVSRARSAHSFF